MPCDGYQLFWSFEDVPFIARSLNGPWLNALAMFCALAIEPAVFGEEEKKAAPAAEKCAETEPEKKSATEFDPFQVPETKDLQEISNYITKLMRWSPPRNNLKTADKEAINSVSRADAEISQKFSRGYRPWIDLESRRETKESIPAN